MMGLLIWLAVGIGSMWILKGVLKIEIKTYGHALAALFGVITGPLSLILLLFALGQRHLDLLNKKLPWVKNEE